MAKVHSFLITASFGPGDVLALLKKVAEDPRHREHGAAFTFDWIKRKATLSAATASGLEAMVTGLRKGLAASKAGEGALLIGKAIEQADGRHEVPIGIAVMDAATFAELIGETLIESGLLGIKIIDTAEGCHLHVPATLMTRGLPYDDLITGFPVPPYVKIEDRGFQEAPRAEGADASKKKGGRK
jgi:hypothetical protein